MIENKPGGDGIVGITAFVGAKDDHILLLSPTSAFTAHPFLHDNLPYKPEDLAPIARVSNTFVGITVPVASPANSLNELASAVRAKPGELNWAGVTGANAFMFEAWLKANKLDMKKVPYRNAVDAGARPRREPRAGLPVRGRHRPAADRGSARSSCSRCSTPCGRRPIPTFRRWRRPVIRR